MYHVRNVIVHRGSVADRRLILACPWLNLKAGDKVEITHEILGKYFKALNDYLMIVIRRLGVKYDVDIDALIRRNMRTDAEDHGDRDGTLGSQHGSAV